jgi:hypothetical protein
MGDSDGKRGPGRGNRKRKNVEMLSQKLCEIISDKQKFEKVLHNYPGCGKIPLTALAALEHELHELPRELKRFKRNHDPKRWEDRCSYLMSRGEWP